MNKIILQTSKVKPSSDHSDKIMKYASGWKYLHFNDKEILDFFDKNPIPGFEGIKERFYEIPRGEHRADLFRYYFLYLYGGMFLDLDIVLLKNIDDLVSDYDFVSAKEDATDQFVFNDTKRGRVFNGYMYTKAKSPIILLCLQHIYNIPISSLNADKFDNRYYHICEFLYDVCHAHNSSMNIMLYDFVGMPGEIPTMIMSGKDVVAKHEHSIKE